MESPSKSQRYSCRVRFLTSEEFLGHWKRPLSNRLYKRQNPSPSYPNIRIRTGWFPASLQAIKCWRIQLATHERRSIGSYSRTISQADAGIRNRCKTSNRGTDRSSKNNVIVQFVENKISVFYTGKRYKKFF